MEAGWSSWCFTRSYGECEGAGDTALDEGWREERRSTENAVNTKLHNYIKKHK